jgi:hypothetical protein
LEEKLFQSIEENRQLKSLPNISSNVGNDSTKLVIQQLMETVYTQARNELDDPAVAKLKVWIE